MDMQIETDVPIPRRKSGRTSKFEYLLGLKIKESVVLANYKQANAAQMLLNRHGMLATIRKLDDGTYRLWRIV